MSVVVVATMAPAIPAKEQRRLDNAAESSEKPKERRREVPKKETAVIPLKETATLTAMETCRAFLVSLNNELLDCFGMSTALLVVPK